MATNDDIKILLDRYMRIEGEIKLLQDDKKELLAEFKDKIDPKAFQPQEKQEFDQALHVLEGALSIEHID
jgi:uncharacterized protein (UPF0335 family)